ncbi:MAG TPA: hypothetical protein VMR17_09900 [Xanthobacteraceae bacterium]|jgi:hypothetical protein|nr:hypothetical protein [Xanthobacteraceae bacterium]
MKWQAALAAALASAVVSFVASSIAAPTVASAEIRIVSDPGGEVSSYVRKYEEVRDSGERVVIDGPCLSACTLLTGIVPRSHVCVTERAVLGFHAASYYDDASRSLVPTREGSNLVMRLYPANVRGWINSHGGLTPRLIELRGRALTAMYSLCQ